MELQGGGDIGQEDKGDIDAIGRKARGESFKDAEFGDERAAIIHIDFVFAGPVEGFAGDDLETFEVDLMFAIEADIIFWEIVADNPDELDGGEKAGGDSGVAGGAAEKARVEGAGGFDGIQGG